MIGRRRRVARRTVAAATVGIVALLAVFPCAAADPNDDDPGDDEPRCNRHDDLSCTVVRETTAGVWVWTARFRPAEPNSPTWSIAVGTAVVGAAPTVKFLPIPPATRSPTPNGAPILE
ncbi:MAG TPA: hypothetical protein VGP07_06110 [Polyangia bacterium]|jgi:hypothetical protein